MAWKQFITNILGLTGAAESGAKLFSYTKGTTTPLAVYTDEGATPATNPVVADSIGQISIYFNDTLEYSWKATSADEATTFWEVNVLGGILTLTYINPAYNVFPIIEASWAQPLASPLGDGWAAAFALPKDDTAQDNYIVVDTVAELNALSGSTAEDTARLIARSTLGDMPETSYRWASEPVNPRTGL